MFQPTHHVPQIANQFRTATPLQKYRNTWNDEQTPLEYGVEQELHKIAVHVRAVVRAQSIARQHTTYVIIAKKLKFRELLFGKIKKEEFARRIFKKKECIFSFKMVK
jgi:hypothetical protein